MKRKKNIFIFTYIVVWLITPFFVYSQEHNDKLQKLIVFYSPSCHRCIEVKNEVMPEIEKEFKDIIFIEYRDIADIENYKLMLSLKQTYQVKDIKDLPIFYLAGRFLDGGGDIKNKLKGLIAGVLNIQTQRQALSRIDLIAHFKTFKPLTIISAGLIDGINPCAFTVIVFFISFLALQGYKKKELSAIGLSFIFAVFLTYLFIGLGIFNFLYQLRGFWLVTRIVNISVGIFSIILGMLAIYDFFKFKKTHDTEGLFLQLPKGIKNRIHYVIGLHYRKTSTSPSQESTQKKHIFRLVITALLTGFLVSILEAICTGQTYLPTIIFILKTTALKLPALGYLALYNLMFAVPLLSIFLFALLGTTSQQFSKFLKQHLLAIKIFMAIIFFGLGIFLIYSP